MNTGVKVALGLTGAMLLAFGIEAAYIHYDRAQSAKSAAAAPDYGPTDPDDLVFLKHKHPETLADLKDLYGQSVWVQAGGQMDYFAASAGHADYSKRVGALPGAAEMKVVEAFAQTRPKNVPTRVPAGNAQVLLAFTMPTSADPSRLYAAPVGYKDATGYTFFTDDIFFYDDPHKLYAWPQPIWQAIDAHHPVTGMNQRQVSLALGGVARQVAGSYTDGEFVYANSGHPIDVTFAAGKVSAFHAADSF
jgi:hypothetical protein